MVIMNFFIIIINVNFDNEIFYGRVKEILDLKEELLVKLNNKEGLSLVVLWNVVIREEMEVKVKVVGVLFIENEDIRSLREFIIYGLKGLLVYMKYVNVLGYEDENICVFM